MQAGEMKEEMGWTRYLIRNGRLAVYSFGLAYVPDVRRDKVFGAIHRPGLGEAIEHEKAPNRRARCFLKVA